MICPFHIEGRNKTTWILNNERYTLHRAETAIQAAVQDPWHFGKHPYNPKYLAPVRWRILFFELHLKKSITTFPKTIHEGREL
jgi:hypothetical protein